MTLIATRALYIKLGEGNRWAKLAFESNTLRFGFHKFPHEASIAAVKAKDFTPVKNFYENEDGVAPGTATRYSNEVREFYTAGTDVLWITFAKGRLWWCFAEAEVKPNEDVDFEAAGSRYRRTINPWSDKDIRGGTLAINALRGSLTTTAGFRGTICRVREFDYLLRRLNGEVTPATEAVRTARLELINVLTPLIRGLHWKDFELLVELVMTQGGWRRVSATGGAQQTIDIELELPLTSERAIVQVKSKLDQSTGDKITSDLNEASGGARVFIAYHTGFVQPSVDQDNVTVIGPAEIAKHCVDLGLTTWVMAKVG
ncbi:MAG TPA: restriction endonuclease [Terracidiphilus sp.]|nr:restriction endonuclease [Terracidiphilus sp.]